MHTTLIMTDVAAAFPGRSQQRVIKMLVKRKAHPIVIRWVDDWLRQRSIETWIDGKSVGRLDIICGVTGLPMLPSPLRADVGRDFERATGGHLLRRLSQLDH